MTINVNLIHSTIDERQNSFCFNVDFVNSLKKPISARYSNGLFTRLPYKDGTVYNVRDNFLKFFKKNTNFLIIRFIKMKTFVNVLRQRMF